MSEDPQQPDWFLSLPPAPTWLGIVILAFLAVGLSGAFITKDMRWAAFSGAALTLVGLAWAIWALSQLRH